MFAVLLLTTMVCGPDTASSDDRDSLATSGALTVSAYNAQNQPAANPQ